MSGSRARRTRPRRSTSSKSELKKFGYDVNRYASDALIGYPGKSSLEILSPQPMSIPCNGYSLSPLTSDAGITGELVYVGAGRASDYEGLDVRGKIVISDGLAMPDKTLASQDAGAIGQIHINDEYIHEMCISPVWGTPIPETATLLPQDPGHRRDQTGRRTRFAPRWSRGRSRCA